MYMRVGYVFILLYPTPQRVHYVPLILLCFLSVIVNVTSFGYSKYSLHAFNLISLYFILQMENYNMINFTTTKKNKNKKFCTKLMIASR